jgi:adenosylcobinamide-GDP ribazoletransferase
MAAARVEPGDRWWRKTKGDAVIVDWRREWYLLRTALMFLTRLPVGRNLPFNEDLLNGSARYFPLVGALVGLIGALVYGIAVLLFPTAIAVLLSMAATILLTGAFHEDGFADVCDGFGGGWQREQVLAIMKDSRVGSYATVGLFLLLTIKFQALEALDNAALVGPALVVGHALSRLLAISYLIELPYVRDADSSKIKPMATRMSGNALRFAVASTLPLLLLISLWQILLIAIVLLVFRYFYGYYIQKRIGGYTGDCLGSAQQIAEVLIYLVLLAV